MPFLLVVSCTNEPARRPNVLLIVIDTLRADHLGSYGHGRDTSPVIDSLAAESVRFERAYATTSWTGGSVASMFTGKYPSSHGVKLLRDRLPDEAQTLAEILRAEGYATAGVISNFVLRTRYNFHQGFDFYLESEAQGYDRITTGPVTAHAKQLLRRFKDLERSDTPFFLFVLYFDPHFAYQNHAEIDFAARRAGRVRGGDPIQKLNRMLGTFTDEERQQLVDLYDEEIRFTDAGVGDLLRTLRDLELYDSTVIVLTADHGEEFLTHGGISHGRTLYEEVTHVPLVVRLPGGRLSGTVVEEPVSLVSLTPTLLRLTGSSADGSAFQAQPLELESQTANPETGAVYSELEWEDGSNDGRPIHAKKSIVVGQLKLIQDATSGQVELYDLARDPDELINLADEAPESVSILLAALEERAALAAGGALERDVLTLSESELEVLRSLGYIR